MLCTYHDLPLQIRQGLRPGPSQMALTSRKAIVAPSLLIHRCPLCLRLGYNPSRPFSCKPYNNAMNATRSPNVDKDLAGYMKKKKSRVVEMKQISGSKIPDDVGVLSHTLIRPPNRDMPRLFGKTWKLRLKVEWWWLKTRVLNFGSYVHIIHSGRFEPRYISIYPPPLTSFLFKPRLLSLVVSAEDAQKQEDALPSPLPSRHRLRPP